MEHLVISEHWLFKGTALDALNGSAVCLLLQENRYVLMSWLSSLILLRSPGQVLRFFLVVDSCTFNRRSEMC
jgi:hypothetical protein